MASTCGLPRVLVPCRSLDGCSGLLGESAAKLLISVVVCTYNPADELLARCLDAILSQDLEQPAWELLVVDNNSHPPVSERTCVIERSVRVVTESTQGLSKARECGVHNTEGSILVFVDDDNLIAPSYLRSVAVTFEDARLGVVSGAIAPEYERQPSPWFKPFEGMLAVRRLDSERNYLTNIPSYNYYFPIGAGMAVRREVIGNYYRSIVDGSAYVPGRVGSELSSAEDIDLDFFAISQGYFVGSVGSLKLWHVIPAARTTLGYISRLAVASTRSAAEVNAKWSGTFGGDVYEFFSSSRLEIRIKYMLSAALSWIPRFRIRYHVFKTFLESTRPRD